jgi:hypothetical protein
MEQLMTLTLIQLPKLNSLDLAWLSGRNRAMEFWYIFLSRSATILLVLMPGVFIYLTDIL